MHAIQADMRRVRDPADIATVAALAHDIWPQHYVPIIGQAQTDYMLARFQSQAAIGQQIADGHQYYLAMADVTPEGYLAIVVHPADRQALLSKLYVQHGHRRTGLGRTMVAFAEKLCMEMDIGELWLTVNRHNTDAIAFYTRVGFATTGTLIQDIGGGFVMDDYRMAKKLDVRGRIGQA
ncbi:MAG: GNAT family N-acetyltransferase [Lentisphaerae bacterium]|nr:GNAT family N-acetyltransferase [Lentisphaerota bacterium]